MSKTNDLKWFIIGKCQHLLNDILFDELDLKIESDVYDFVDMNLNELINNKLVDNETLNDIFTLRLKQLEMSENLIKDEYIDTAVSILTNLYYDMNLDIRKYVEGK